jgi:hypothetical protein
MQNRSPYQYYLLPSANPPPHLVNEHNKIYLFWLKLWRDLCRDLKVSDAQLEEDFHRQDLIAALCADSGVMAVHLYSFFSIESLAAREHRYLASNYPPSFFEQLKIQGVNTVMSMEYMTVNPEWRKRKSDIHIGAVLASLGLSLLDYYSIDAAIAPARRDHKVHELAHTFGGESILENVQNHNIACDLISIRKDKLQAHPQSAVESTRIDLWEKRIHINAFNSSASAPSSPKLKRVA